MQIIVDIADVTYSEIKKGKIYTSFRDVPQESINAIKNGTPLPKNHGRLIDADILTGMISKKSAEPEYQHTGEDWRAGLYLAEDLTYEVPTVLEAESEE